ncbi:chemotaxis protein CheA [Tepidibacillus fermentans]|uniref:Chemotaxis protein CheA n=1 Tax=Tepidibacillus fermentans TaxID=1281767 RepID=A0A4R3KHP4_9BACI|nr:chemotaxis protein CheA [Tepidibacillus fermentans]TCS82959.1 two-component system chemotaxis sensor kinase CheA [Tepidibacillus fermentans]
MELNQYLDIFLEESKEHLQNLNEKLLALETDTQNTDLVNEIFRSAHTLKGMAATMGFEKMASLTHEMENVLDQVRNHKKVVDSNMMDVIFHCVDRLEKMVEMIVNEGHDQVDTEDLITQLETILSGNPVHDLKEVNSNHSTTTNNLQSQTLLTFDEYELTVLLQSMESDFSIYQIQVNLDEETILKSARAFMVFKELENYGEILKSNPPVEEIENDEFGNDFTIILISKKNQEEIRKAILNISEIQSIHILEIKKDQLTSQNQHMETQTVEKNSNKSSAGTNGQQKKHLSAKTIRVDIERLDELMNLFSELVIDRGRLEQLANEINHAELTDTVEHMNRISSNLQNIILNLRMVPVEQVFNRFPRMVRDLAKELNKKVNLNIFGAETELDRTVIDEIGDPLVHLLRNAVDHGLESVEERIKNHKPEEGEITLKAYHSGNYVFIEITDDGRGINREKVLNKAIEKKLITREEGNQLSDKQVYNLLFQSGFSTAEKVSDISGRGVGLDVVKNKIETLGGFVTVDSTPGKGTTFIIQLPLTLSIISAMLVQIQREKYAIPLSSIIETAIYKEKDIMYAHKQQVIDFRGHIVPLIPLKQIFAVPDGEIEEEDISVVIVRKGDKMAGLVVDSFIGQQEIVLKSLGSYLPNVFAISGATILGDGQVALIIDTNALIK